MKPCDCKSFALINDKLVCVNCKRPMKSQRKEQTNIARRHKSKYQKNHMEINE